MAKPAPNIAPPGFAAGTTATRVVVAGALDDLYTVDTARPLQGAGGGLPAFAATAKSSPRASLMAVQLRADAPARILALEALSGLSLPGVLTPLACGPAAGAAGRPVWYVICPAPPGPALWANPAQPPPAISELDLIDLVLRPAAAALAVLAERGVTHRAIRPDNLFLTAGSAGIVLGSAWAAPPAMFQPAVFEPPYVAMCPPAARGQGSIADDIYALGVVLLTLALGHIPMSDLTDEEVIQRKLELGCHPAMTAGARLPQMLDDLLVGMLADDPQHRLAPALLADPRVMRRRPVAKPKPRLAGQSLVVNDIAVWHPRMLAYALARQPATAARLLRLGVVDHWLRRGLGDAVLASRVEDSVRAHDAASSAPDANADALAIMRTIGQLDPLAPLCWDGLAMWPDGLGAALASVTSASDPTHGKLTGLIASEAVAVWTATHPAPGDVMAARMDSRTHRGLLRERGWCGGLARLSYTLNALQPCRSKLLAGFPAVRLAELLPALDAAAPPAGKHAAPPGDREIVAFIASRRGAKVDRDLAALSDVSSAEDVALAQLRLLAPLQIGGFAAPLPRLAGWLAACLAPQLEGWRNRPLRTRKQAALDVAAASGTLAGVLDVFESAGERQADEHGFQAVHADVARIDAELAVLDAAAAGRAIAARRLGQEAASAVALALAAVCAVAAAAG